MRVGETGQDRTGQIEGSKETGSAVLSVCLDGELRFSPPLRAVAPSIDTKDAS